MIDTSKYIYCLKLNIGSYDSEQQLCIAVADDVEKFKPIEKEWEDIQAKNAIDCDEAKKLADAFFEKYKVLCDCDDLNERNNESYAEMYYFADHHKDAIEDSMLFISAICLLI